MPRAIFFDMDDTLLDAVQANMIAWESVCAEVAPQLGCDAEKLRLTIRKEGGAFWKDESVVGHWRLDLEGARAIVVEKALLSLGGGDFDRHDRFAPNQSQSNQIRSI